MARGKGGDMDGGRGPAWIAGLVAAALLGCSAAPRPELLLLLSVDTLRADRLGCYGNALDLTPNLDALAAQSQLFEYAFAPAPFTLASVSSLFTGRYPEELGVLGNHATLPEDVPTLASQLAEAGVRTGAVVGNWVLRRDAGLARGFEIYDDEFSDREAVRPLPERIADATTDAALAVLDRLRDGAGGPVFLWVHYQDPHGPYTPPPGYREAFLEAERSAPGGRRRIERGRDLTGLGWIPTYQFLGGQHEVAFYRAGYDGEVRYLDEQIGRFWQGLEARDLTDRTILVFTSDHGEGLGEDDYWFAHGEYVSAPLVRVPLLVRAPGLAPARRSDVASLLDVFATLLGLASQAAPPPSRGRDLLASGAEAESSEVYLANLGSGVHSRWGLVKDGYHYQVHLEGLAPEEQAQPLSAHGVAPDPGVLEALRARLAAIRREVSGKVEMRPQHLSEADRERLRALGYMVEP